MNTYSKITVAFVGAGLLLVGFQNCGGDVKAGSVGADQPSTSSAPSSASTPNHAAAVTCSTYSVSGDPSTIHNTVDMSGRVTSTDVPVGTVIYQSVGCNGRPLDTGYQAPYCNAISPNANCGSCMLPPGNYKCGADGNWASN